jgi:uncharacterized protein (TIGR02001 family)
MEKTMTNTIAIKSALAATVLSVGLLATPAVADEAESAFSLTGNISLNSDYRFRGVSLNEENIAVQGGLDAAYALGGISLFAGTWLSSGDSDTFGDVELDLYGGITGSIGEAASWKLGVITYLYPDVSDFDYYEIYGTIGGSLGAFGTEVGVYYAPDQTNVFSDDNFYIYGKATYAIPETPIVLSSTLGYEDGGFADDKIDWTVAAAYTFQMFELKLAYVDTNRRVTYKTTKDAADATVVVSLAAYF